MKRGFSGLYVDQPEWSGGFLKRVRIAEEERKIMATTYNGDNMTLRQMLFTDKYIELNFSILRKIARSDVRQLKSDLIEKELNVYQESTLKDVAPKFEHLQKRVVQELYAENIVMGSGWTFFEPEGDDTYASVTSIWKVSDETRAQWERKEAQEVAAYKEWWDGLSIKKQAEYDETELD